MTKLMAVQLYIWSSTVGGPITRATTFHFHKMNLVRPKHLRTLPTEKRLMGQTLFCNLVIEGVNKMSRLRLSRLEIAVKIGSEPRTNKFLSKRENPSDSERSHGPFYPELFVLQTNERRKCIQQCMYPKPKGYHAQSSVKSQSSDDPAFVLRNLHHC